LSVGRFTSYNILGSVVPLILTFVTVPLYIHLVGIERVGILSLAWLLLGYFGLFDLGLGKATAYRIAAQRNASAKERAATLWGALIVNIGMGVVGGLLLWGAGHVYFSAYFKVDEALRPEILAAVPLLALSVPVVTLTGVLTGALQGREKFLETNMISALSTILFQLLPLGVALLWGPALSGLLLAALFARALALVAMWRICRREFTSGHSRVFERETMLALLRYGGWVSFNGLIGPILVIVDRFAIGNVLGAKLLGFYHVAFQIAKQLAIIPGSLTSALFPKLTAASPEESRLLGRKALLTLAATLTLPVMIGIFMMEPFLNLWVGREIGAHAAPVGRILLVGFWCNAMALVPFTHLQAAGRPRTVSIILLLQIPLYLAGLYVAMTGYGIVGCAVALAVRFGVDFVMQSFAAHRQIEAAPELGGSLILLVGAVILSNKLLLTDPLWWVGALLLVGVATVAAYRLLPADVRIQMTSIIARFLPSQGAS
jgi:O-antigen/teichoic acid export membrane protein